MNTGEKVSKLLGKNRSDAVHSIMLQTVRLSEWLFFQNKF